MRCIAELSTWSDKSENARHPRYRSVQAAVGAILAHHPYCTAQDGSGKPVTIETPDSKYVAANGILAVLWKDEGDRVKGDLSKAFAVIRPV